MGKPINETNYRYGRWLVLEQAANSRHGDARWLCQCDCGEKRIVRGSNLRSGHSKSCGCLRSELTSLRAFVDEIGNRHGRWIVIKRVENNEWGDAKWLCRCDCGNEGVVSGFVLRRGESQSCGCLRRIANSHSRSLTKGESSFNTLLYSMKQGAKKRGLKWNLTREQVAALTKQYCFYCGVKPRQHWNMPNCNGDYIYNGIDRKNNDKGYVPENVVPCCKTCNYAKRKMSVEEFTSWIHRAHEHLAGI